MKNVVDKTLGKRSSKPIKLKTREEYRKYLATHLKPTSYGPKGQPIYRASEVAQLNIHSC